MPFAFHLDETPCDVAFLSVVDGEALFSSDDAHTRDVKEATIRQMGRHPVELPQEWFLSQQAHHNTARVLQAMQCTIQYLQYCRKMEEKKMRKVAARLRHCEEERAAAFDELVELREATAFYKAQLRDLGKSSSASPRENEANATIVEEDANPRGALLRCTFCGNVYPSSNALASHYRKRHKRSDKYAAMAAASAVVATSTFSPSPGSGDLFYGGMQKRGTAGLLVAEPSSGTAQLAFDPRGDRSLREEVSELRLTVAKLLEQQTKFDRGMPPGCVAAVPLHLFGESRVSATPAGTGPLPGFTTPQLRAEHNYQPNHQGNLQVSESTFQPTHAATGRSRDHAAASASFGPFPALGEDDDRVHAEQERVRGKTNHLTVPHFDPHSILQSSTSHTDTLDGRRHRKRSSLGDSLVVVSPLSRSASVITGRHPKSSLVASERQSLRESLAPSALPVSHASSTGSCGEEGLSRQHRRSSGLQRNASPTFSSAAASSSRYSGGASALQCTDRQQPTPPRESVRKVEGRHAHKNSHAPLVDSLKASNASPQRSPSKASPTASRHSHTLEAISERSIVHREVSFTVSPDRREVQSRGQAPSKTKPPRNIPVPSAAVEAGKPLTASAMETTTLSLPSSVANEAPLHSKRTTKKEKGDNAPETGSVESVSLTVPTFRTPQNAKLHKPHSSGIHVVSTLPGYSDNAHSFHGRTPSAAKGKATQRVEEGPTPAPQAAQSASLLDSGRTPRENPPRSSSPSKRRSAHQTHMTKGGVENSSPALPSVHVHPDSRDVADPSNRTYAPNEILLHLHGDAGDATPPLKTGSGAPTAVEKVIPVVSLVADASSTLKELPSSLQSPISIVKSVVRATPPSSSTANMVFSEQTSAPSGRPQPSQEAQDDVRHPVVVASASDASSVSFSFAMHQIGSMASLEEGGGVRPYSVPLHTSEECVSVLASTHDDDAVMEDVVTEDLLPPAAHRARVVIESVSRAPGLRTAVDPGENVASTSQTIQAKGVAAAPRAGTPSRLGTPSVGSISEEYSYYSYASSALQSAADVSAGAEESHSNEGPSPGAKRDKRTTSSTTGKPFPRRERYPPAVIANAWSSTTHDASQPSSKVGKAAHHKDQRSPPRPHRDTGTYHSSETPALAGHRRSSQSSKSGEGAASGYPVAHKAERDGNGEHAALRSNLTASPVTVSMQTTTKRKSIFKKLFSKVV